MSEISDFTNGNENRNRASSSLAGSFAVSRIRRLIIAPFTRPVMNVAGWIRVRKFRRDVIRQLPLTIGNFHPEIIIGGTDRTGGYAEIYLEFGNLRLRITREIYAPERQELWADIGGKSDRASFFRMDFVLAALARLHAAGELPTLPQDLNTLAALDAAIWAVHDMLVERLSPEKYADTKKMIQQVIHEAAATPIAQ